MHTNTQPRTRRWWNDVFGTRSHSSRTYIIRNVPCTSNYPIIHFISLSLDIRFRHASFYIRNADNAAHDEHKLERRKNTTYECINIQPTC